MMLQMLLRNRRKPAQNRSASTRRFSKRSDCGSVDHTLGAKCPASGENYLFRTPSLIGQVRARCPDLPDFFSYQQLYADVRRDRQVHARALGEALLRLRASATRHCLRALPARQREGWDKCQRSEFGQPLQFVQVSQRAATRLVNRPFWAPGPARQPRLYLIPMPGPALRLARRATCFTASRIPANATDAVACQYRPRAPAFRPILRMTRPGDSARAGLPFLMTPKTKDIPCSRRS